MGRIISDRSALVEQAVKMRQDGLTIPQVAAKLGASPSTVLRWCQSPEWYSKIHSPGAKPGSEQVEGEDADDKTALRYYRDRCARYEAQDDRTTLIANKLLEAQSVVRPPHPFVPSKMGPGDPETAVLLFSDGQIGQVAKKSETGFYDYNIKVFEQELRYLFDKFLYIVQLHRKSIPIKAVHIFFLGDNLENETVFAGQPFEIELDVMEQFFLGVELITWFLVELSRHFDEVHTHWTSGNHGRLGRIGEHKWTVNWDYLFAKFIEQKLSACKNVTFDIPKKWWNIVPVEGWKFLVIHGEDIRRYMKFPWYDTARFDADYSKILQSIGETFTYLMFAHHHVPIQWDSPYGERIANGTFVGYNVWALKRLRASVRPSQMMFMVHPRVGIASRYIIRLDTKEKKK